MNIQLALDFRAFQKKTGSRVSLRSPARVPAEASAASVEPGPRVLCLPPAHQLLQIHAIPAAEQRLRRTERREPRSGAADKNKALHALLASRVKDSCTSACCSSTPRRWPR